MVYRRKYSKKYFSRFSKPHSRWFSHLLSRYGQVSTVRDIVRDVIVPNDEDEEKHFAYPRFIPPRHVRYFPQPVVNPIRPRVVHGQPFGPVPEIPRTPWRPTELDRLIRRTNQFRNTPPAVAYDPSRYETSNLLLPVDNDPEEDNNQDVRRVVGFEPYHGRRDPGEDIRRRGGFGVLNYRNRSDDELQRRLDLRSDGDPAVDASVNNARLYQLGRHNEDARDDNLGREMLGDPRFYTPADIGRYREYLTDIDRLCELRPVVRPMSDALKSRIDRYISLVRGGMPRSRDRESAIESAAPGFRFKNYWFDPSVDYSSDDLTMLQTGELAIVTGKQIGRAHV